MADKDMCQEIEACRSLIKELEEEARKRSPFSEEFVELEKLKNYIELLGKLKALKDKEKDLLETFAPKLYPSPEK